MIKYLLCSGTKCLDFQSNDNQNLKSGTHVKIPNSSISSVADPPLSIPTKDSVPVLVSVYATDHYKTILTVVVKNSTRGPGGWFGIY